MAAAFYQSHPDFFNVDILPEVVGYGNLSRSEATKVARVCKGWQHAALDVVWEGPVGLEHLIRLLATTKGGKFRGDSLVRLGNIAPSSNSQPFVYKGIYRTS